MFKNFKPGIKKCPQCGSMLIQLQQDQWLCREERILYVCYDVSAEEMVEWMD